LETNELMPKPKEKTESWLKRMFSYFLFIAFLG
jgi:hypothetical protein